jgi:hypothetical protein
VKLYAPALGHLLLNREQEKMDRMPQLDPRDEFAHIDMLAELRMLETVRQPLDRRVLEAYPLLNELFVVREESPAVLGLVINDLLVCFSFGTFKSPGEYCFGVPKASNIVYKYIIALSIFDALRLYLWIVTK